MLLIDGHVHVYPCFDAARLLTAACANFDFAMGRSSRTPTAFRVLFLTETSRDHWFRDAAAGRVQVPGWAFRPTEEPVSLIARREDGAEVCLVAGRQVAGREGLEVLALGTDQDIPDGGSTEDVLDAVKKSGAMPVIPWGVGKWLGRRGGILDRMIESRAGDFLLGDNGGRPWCWPEPLQFKAAEARGSLVLPGSDPLPFAGEESRAGSCGALLDTDIPGKRPAAEITELIRSRSYVLVPFGRRETSFRFVRNQVSMQFVKARRK